MVTVSLKSDIKKRAGVTARPFSPDQGQNIIFNLRLDENSYPDPARKILQVYTGDIFHNKDRRITPAPPLKDSLRKISLSY